MSKYIDAKWLKSRVHDVPLANGAIHGCVDKLDLIEAPSIDIVRCRECKYAHMTYGGECKYCDIWKDDDGNYIEAYHDGDHFCGYGERNNK